MSISSQLIYVRFIDVDPRSKFDQRRTSKIFYEIIVLTIVYFI